MRIAVILFMLTNVFINHGNDESTITIGVFADCQYCDCETAGSRFGRMSAAITPVG